MILTEVRQAILVGESALGLETEEDVVRRCVFRIDIVNIVCRHKADVMLAGKFAKSCVHLALLGKGGPVLHLQKEIVFRKNIEQPLEILGYQFFIVLDDRPRQGSVETAGKGD